MALNDLSLSRSLTQHVERLSAGLEEGNAPILDQVSPITAELLRYWFKQEYQDGRIWNFHEGQKQAILNTIYAHEVLKVPSLKDLYEKACPTSLIESSEIFTNQAKHNHPKYCLKMATGTGKTWVLQALLIWQFLNAQHFPGSTRFTKNFLIVAPGLIVYERLIDAFLGKEKDRQRDFFNSDLYQFRDLFVPENYRDLVFPFLQSSVCLKEEIGRKATAGGIIAITNKDALEVEEKEWEDLEDIAIPGQTIDPKKVVDSILPLFPGSNDLSDLNRKYEKRGILQYCFSLKDLLVFNDEAHHIHETKKDGEASEVEWQKSLNHISSSKKERFIQIDFSATPYIQTGSGKSAKRSYFPHIICDFDLKTAMSSGLVKSLVLDKRKEIGAIPNAELHFKCDRDEVGNPTLSDGQRIMLRAGLKKLQQLQSDFSRIAPEMHPKMLVVCEDTEVTPLVEQFMLSEGLSSEEVLRVDSRHKEYLSREEWSRLKERLFDLDRSPSPRVVISVLMLREGFDVNNICVIVPLRATGRQILLEQTIGRGLRLMWRESEYEENKKENRALIRSGKEPTSLIDVLTIIEHPAFLQFYEDLKEEGLEIGISGDESSGSSTGDLIPVGLRDGYEAFDFTIPFILRDKEEELSPLSIDVHSVEAFDTFTFEQLKGWRGKGDSFTSVDFQNGTQFGDYRVDGGVMTATGYNEYLGRMVSRITTSLTTPITKSSKVFANQSKFPFLQINKPQLAEWIDTYIRTRLFGKKIDPLEDENWRILLLDPIANHINRVWARRLLTSDEENTVVEPVLKYHKLSEVSKITMRQAFSIPVTKCIYERLRYPSRNGDFEKRFIEKANGDSQVERFCKIDEHKHGFLKLRYINTEGSASFYHPDFLVKIEDDVFMVEPKATDQGIHPNVQRKSRAALAWCENINQLPPHERMNANWSYVLIEQDKFEKWSANGANLKEILDLAKIRDKSRDQLTFV